MRRSQLNIILSIAIPIFLLYACSEKDGRRAALSLYEKREYLIKEFGGESIINRNDKFYELAYYKDGLVDKFFFEKKGDTLEFISDSSQFPITNIKEFINVDSLNRKGVLGSELHRKLKIMDSLKIDNISSDFASLGIDMKIYLREYKALLYISDMDKVKNEEWKACIKGGEKIDKNWYYVKDEF